MGDTTRRDNKVKNIFDVPEGTVVTHQIGRRGDIDVKYTGARKNPRSTARKGGKPIGTHQTKRSIESLTKSQGTRIFNVKPRKDI